MRRILFFLLVFHSSLIAYHPSLVYAQAPGPETTAPSGGPVVSEAPTPSTEPALPGPDLQLSAPESTSPNPESAVTSDEPVAPSAESAGPSSEPATLAAEPAAPSAEAVAPGGQAGPPSPEPVTPSTELVAPSPDPATPQAAPVVPSSEPAVPGPKPAVAIVEPRVTSPQSPVPGLATPAPRSERAIKIGRFSFGFLTGFYQPQLSTLNSILSNRQSAILADPNFLLPSNPSFRAEARNIPADGMGLNPWVGLEAQWAVSDSFALRFTGGVWRGESLADDTIVTFLRSNIPQIVVPRTARYNLILDQFFVDWRYYFLNDPRRGRLSVDLGVLGVTLGFLTLDSIVKVVHPAAPGGGFASVSSTEAMGLTYTSRYGLSGEYFLGSKLALGFSAYYVLGQMTNLAVTRHFPAGFPQIPVPEPLSIRAGVPLPTTPPTPNEGETLTYATTTTVRGVETVGPRQNLILELDGLEVSGFLKFFF